MAPLDMPNFYRFLQEHRPGLRTTIPFRSSRIRSERIDPPTLSPVQPRNSNPKRSLCHLGGLLQSAPSVPQIVEVVRSSGLHWSSTWQPCLWHDLQHRRALATSHEEHLAQRLTTFCGQKYHSVNRTRGWLLKCLTWNFESKCSICLLSYRWGRISTDIIKHLSVKKYITKAKGRSSRLSVTFRDSIISIL